MGRIQDFQQGGVSGTTRPLMSRRELVGGGGLIEAALGWDGVNLTAPPLYPPLVAAVRKKKII